MRRLLIAVLAVPLLAAAPRGTVALGVGAASSSEVIVKIAGKNVNVKLAGVNNGTYAGQAFLQCLVANRVVRVDRAAGRVTMLDGSSVADHLAEFLQTKTASDPCALGKASYVPQPPALASSVVVNPPNGEAAPAAAPKREGHVSFGSGNTLSGGLNLGPASPAPASSSTAKSGAAANAQKPASDQPTIYRPPTMVMTTPSTAQTTTPPTQGTTTVGTTGTTTPTTVQTYTPPTASTTTIPTTTTSPP